MLFLHALHRESLREATGAREQSSYKLHLQQRKARFASHSITTSGHGECGGEAEEEEESIYTVLSRLEIIEDYNDQSIAALISVCNHDRARGLSLTYISNDLCIFIIIRILRDVRKLRYESCRARNIWRI